MPFSRIELRNAAGIARDQRAIHVRLRDRVPSAFGQRLGAVADHLAAVEQPGDERMLLEAIERHVRVEQRILVVEPDHETDRQPSVGHRVDEPAAELVVPQRIAERVDDGAGREAIGRHLPQLLEADRELLGLSSPAELKTPQQLLGQVAAHAVAEDRDLGVDVDAGSNPALCSPCRPMPRSPVATPITRGAVDEDVLPGEAGEEIDAVPFGLLRQPAYELVQRDDVVAVIAQRRRDDRKRDAGRLR